MTRKKKPTSGNRPKCPNIDPLPVEKMLPARALLGPKAFDVEVRKLNEVAELLWMPDGLSDDEKHARITRAVELYESLAPRDGLEGMLAIQMVGAHHAAIECLRRAGLPNQTGEGRDMNLRHAARLMGLYERQVAALDKHRGKGQQKVTVEHVHVEAGGQAIVGHVEAGPEGRPEAHDAAPPALEQRRTMPADLRAPARVPRAGSDG